MKSNTIWYYGISPWAGSLSYTQVSEAHFKMVIKHPTHIQLLGLDILVSLFLPRLLCLIKTSCLWSLSSFVYSVIDPFCIFLSPDKFGWTVLAVSPWSAPERPEPRVLAPWSPQGWAWTSTASCPHWSQSCWTRSRNVFPSATTWNQSRSS